MTKRAMLKFDVGPVFWCEWRRASQDRWFYAARAALVGGLLAALAAVSWAASKSLDLTQSSSIGLARDWCYRIVVLTQISMLLLVAPASTAGAFSTEIARGHVLLMLVTGLSPAEIVCGTLCARLLPVLWGALCVFPVLVLCSRLVGISLLDLVHVEIVAVGTAVLGCTLALALSIGARRLHETLMATYVILLGWVLGLPILFMIGLTSVGRLIPVWLSRWSRDVNPYWIVRQPTSAAWPYAPHEPWIFFACSISLAIALAAIASLRLRPSALEVTRASTRVGWFARLSIWPFVSLDALPVFWRECRLQQPSRWIGLLWRFYIVGAVFFSALSVWESATKAPRLTGWVGLFNGFQAAVGLLLLSATVPAALAEDRARGSLELLLSTPIPTRSIVLSKWCAYYRAVPTIAFLPALVAFAHDGARERWIGAVLVAARMLAQGAAVTSLGIALAVWVRRVDRALILSATVMVMVTVASVPLAVVLFQGTSLSQGLASASPFLGIGLLTTSMSRSGPAEWSSRVGWAASWILIYSALGFGLLWAALASFDRCVGRVGGRSRTARSLAIQSAHSTGQSPVLAQVTFDQHLETPVDVEPHCFSLGDRFGCAPLICSCLVQQNERGGARSSSAMHEHLVGLAAVLVDEVADVRDSALRQGGSAHAIVQVLKPQGPSLLAFLGRVHRLIGLAVIPEVDDPAVALFLELSEVGLGGLITDGNFRRHRSHVIHRSVLSLVFDVPEPVHVVRDSITSERIRSLPDPPSE